MTGLTRYQPSVWSILRALESGRLGRSQGFELAFFGGCGTRGDVAAGVCRFPEDPFLWKPCSGHDEQYGGDITGHVAGFMERRWKLNSQGFMRGGDLMDSRHVDR